MTSTTIIIIIITSVIMEAYKAKCHKHMQSFLLCLFVQ